MNCKNALNAFPFFTAAESAKVRNCIDALPLLFIARVVGLNCVSSGYFVLYFFFSSPAFQVKHWKHHKKECSSLNKARVKANQSDKEIGWFELPWFFLSLSPSLTNYPKQVYLFLPLWDLHDEKQRRELSSRAERQSLIVNDIKKFFKLEQLGAKISLEMVGNMCMGAMTLYFLGYKGSDGCAIRRVPKHELVDALENKKGHSILFLHYTQVPKGWTISAQDRLSLSPDRLAELEKGIEGCRKEMGEREAL